MVALSTITKQMATTQPMLKTAVKQSVQALRTYNLSTVPVSTRSFSHNIHSNPPTELVSRKPASWIRVHKVSVQNGSSWSPFGRPALESNERRGRRTYATISNRQDQNNNQIPKPGETPPPTDPNLNSQIPPSKTWTFEEINSLISSTNNNTQTTQTILIDVREPSELHSTGKIPSARNIPISTAPDSFFLSPEEFEDQFGFEKPGPNTRVVFYCKAGVRSRAAARLAGQAGFGGEIGEFPGSWVEWFAKGGEVER